MLFSLCFMSCFSLSAHKPGDIEVLLDMLLEDFKNFPQVRELGESSAQFIQQEMERTWGEGHLAVLSEEEAQNWLLGVGSLFSPETKCISDPLPIFSFITNNIVIFLYSPCNSSDSLPNWRQRQLPFMPKPYNI